MPQFPSRLLLWPMLLAPCLPAQESAPVPVPYRVEITLREPGAPAAQATRRYTILTGTKGKGVFRLDHRVPYLAGPPSNPQAAGQYVSSERSLFIECGVSDAGAAQMVSLSLSLGITDLVRGEKSPEEGGPPLVPAVTRIQADMPVHLGARARVASIDDPVLPRRYEVEVLVQRAP